MTEPAIIRSPNAQAPKEFEEFAFLAGDWDCDVRQLMDNGEFIEVKTRLVGTYTLDGYAFQDDMLVPFGFGLGTTFRTYDPIKKRWACRWLEAGRDASVQFTNEWFYGNFIDGEMRLQGPGEDADGAYENRIIFSNITDDSFSWTLSRTYDGGETWAEAIGTLEAKRRR
ncbi:MAG: hypothetical protein ABJP90_16215 [Paracoccaceae bacterium]